VKGRALARNAADRERAAYFFLVPDIFAFFAGAFFVAIC